MRPHIRATGHSLALVAAVALAVAFLSAPAAQAASQAPATVVAAPDGVESAATAVARLGPARTAGFYRDPATGRLVVTVTDAAAARIVRSAGATPRSVARSGALLRRATDALGRSARITGTAWVADPRSDRVEVFADESVTGARLGRLQAVVRPFGDTVRLHRVAGTFSTRLSGGDPIYGNGYRCSAAVNVVGGGGSYYFLTAGHCGTSVGSWYTSSNGYLGTTVGSSFPGNDYAIALYGSGVPHPGTIGTQDVTSAGNAYVGERVCMRGGTSGVRCGTVLALNATVNYAQGIVYGLIKTNICAEPGDSGAPLYDGGKVLGILSGGSGNCTSGGISFFQPVTEPLSAYGVSVY